MDVREITEKYFHTCFDSLSFFMKADHYYLKYVEKLKQEILNFTDGNAYYMLGLVTGMGLNLNECQLPY